MRSNATLAPEWQVNQWFNAKQPLRLADLRGKVVVVHAFQMLCPGCVTLGLPQTQKVFNAFEASEVAVVGLHTVFEHHEVMTPKALEVFIHEYRYTFPIGVDEPGGDSGLPQTMRAYGMRGTPSLILIDHQGYLRKHSFGHEDDMRVGADIATLLSEARTAATKPAAEAKQANGGGCDEDTCTA